MLTNTLVKKYRDFLQQGGKVDPRSDLELTLELGDQLKQTGAFDDQVAEHPDFREQYLSAKQATDRSMAGEVGAGLRRGVSGLASTALGATALGLDVVGAKETARDVAEKARSMGNPDDAATVDNMSDVVDTAGAVRYGLGKIGEVVPSLTEAMVTGILGSMAGTAAAPGAGSAAGAVAGVVGKRAVANLIKKQVAAKILGKEVGEEAVIAALKTSGNALLKDAFVAESKAIGARMGAGALNAVNSYALSAGELYNSTGNAALSAGAGVVAALPDTILPQMVLAKYFKGAVTEEAKKEAGSFFARLAKDAAKTMPVEAGTEAFQELVGIAAEKYNKGEPATLDANDLKRIREAAVGGAVGGAIAAPIAAAPNPDATPTQQTRQQQLDARRRAVTGQPAPVAPIVAKPVAPTLNITALEAMTPEQQDLRITALNRTTTRTDLENKELTVLQALAAQRPAAVAQTAETSPQPNIPTPAPVAEVQPPSAAPAEAAASATPLVNNPTPPPVAPAPVAEVLPTPKELGDRMRQAGAKLSRIIATVPTIDSTEARAQLEAVTKSPTITADAVAKFETAIATLETNSVAESARVASARVAEQTAKNAAKVAAAEKKAADKAAKDAAKAQLAAEKAANKIDAQPQEQPPAPPAPDPLKQNMEQALAPIVAPEPAKPTPLPFKVADVVDAKSPDLLRLDGQFGDNSRTASRIAMAFRDDTDPSIPEAQRPVILRTVNNYSKAEGLKRVGGKDAGAERGISVVAMGVNKKDGKAIKVGGAQQVLLSDVVNGGFTPIARITLDESHTGVVSRGFANTAEFDAAVGATERTVAKQTAVVESQGASSLPSHVFATGDKAIVAAESADPLAAAMTTALAPEATAAFDTSTPGGKIALYYENNPTVFEDLVKRIVSKDGDLRSAKGALTRSFIEKRIAPAAGVTAEDIMQHAVKAWMGAKIGARTDAGLFSELLAKPDPLAVSSDPGEATRYRVSGDTGVRLAPNGKPSKLTARQWAMVRTPEFKAWFGDWEKDPANASKVVDENGEPRVMYHGTDSITEDYTLDENKILKKIDGRAAYNDIYNPLNPGEIIVKRGTGFDAYSLRRIINEGIDKIEVENKPVDGAIVTASEWITIFGEPEISVPDFKSFDKSRFSPHAMKGSGVYTTSSSLVAGGDGTPVGGGYARKRGGGGKVADDGTGGRVLPLFLSIKNPFVDLPGNIEPLKVVNAALQRMLAAGNVRFSDSTGNYIYIDADRAEDFMRLLPETPESDLFGGGKLFGARGSYLEKGPFKYLADRLSLDGREITELLKHAGFDGLTHTGGLSQAWGAGDPHQVFVAYEPGQVKSALNRGTFNETADLSNRTSGQTAQKLPDRSRDAEHFNALLARLRSQGFDIEVLQREADMVENAFVRDGRIGVVMEDVANANLTNLVGLIHEVGHTEVDRINPAMRERLSRAVDRTIAEVSDGKLIRAAKNANQNWEEKLVETTAIKLAEEGFGSDSKSLAATIWRTVKDAYYRVGMAMLKALGVEPNDAMVLRWYENNLRRRLGGDYDYRYVDLFAPFIERAARRVNRFTVIDGQSIANLLDPLTGALRHAEVLPDSIDAAEWNINRYRLTRSEGFYKGKKFSEIIAAVQPEDAPAWINPNSIPLGAAVDSAYRLMTETGSVKAADGKTVTLATPDNETARQIYGTTNATEAQAIRARAIHLVTHGDNRTRGRPEKIAGVGLIVRTLETADLVLDAASTDARTPDQRHTVYVKLYRTPDRDAPTWHFVRVDNAGRLISQHTSGPFGGYATPNVEGSTVKAATGEKNEAGSTPLPRPQTKSIAPTEGAPAGLEQLNDLAALVGLVNPSGWSKEKLSAVVIQSVSDGTITEEESAPLLGWIAQATPDQRKEVFKKGGGGLLFREESMGAELDMDYTEAMARVQSSAIGALMPTLKRLKSELGERMNEAEFWKLFGRGEQPAAIVDRLESRAPGSATAVIGGERMTEAMNQRARYQAFKLANALDRINQRRAAADEERITKYTDEIVGRADRFTKVATQYRDANAMLSEFNDGMLGLVKELAVDLDRGPDTAFASGKLLGAIREIERLAPDAAIPEEYQRVFKALLDSNGANVFDHLSAISRLNLNVGAMTIADIVAAIRGNADADSRLKSLAEQKPLMVALATLARTQSRNMDMLQLRSMKDTAQYLSLKAELDEIRTAAESRLDEIAKGIAATADATSLRDRLRLEFLKARREFTAAQRSINRAQENKLLRERFSVAMRERAVELSREVGAFSFWEATNGATYHAMQRSDDGQWSAVPRTLRMVGDEVQGQHEQLANDLAMNRIWLEQNREHAGERHYEEVRRQVDELTRMDFAKNYEAAHRFWFDKWLQPLGQKFAGTGEIAGTKIKQMLNRWQSVMFQHTDEVEAASHRWDRALQEAATAAGYSNPRRFFDEVMSSTIYHVESEPGRDEAGALRAGRQAARDRITGEVATNFNDKLDALLRAHREMSELLNRTAEKNGVYVADGRMKDPLTNKGTLLRHAIKYGWLTSTRRLNGDVVQVMVHDMQKAGWQEGMFADIPEGTDFAAVVQKYFTPAVVEKFAQPFALKPGKEVFFGATDKYGNAANVSQFTATEAWSRAGGDVLAFIDRLYEMTAKQGGQTQDAYRAAMLGRFSELYEMMSRIAAKSEQTKGAFEGDKDGKSHRLMDGRTNDLIPPEMFRYDVFSPVDARRALTEIAFHSAFGRDGQSMDLAIADLETSLRENARRYRMIPRGTRREMAAFAAQQGWDFKKIERAAADVNSIQGWKAKLVKHFTGKEAVVGDARALLELMQLNTSLVLNQPKSGLWNLLSLLEYPVIYRGLGKTSLRSTATAARVFGREVASSFIQAFGVNINRTADYAKEIADLVEKRQTERLPIGTLLSDIGPDGRFASGGLGNRVTQVSRGIQTAMRKGVGAGGFNALWAPFHFISSKADTAIATANVQALEMIVKRAADFYEHNHEAHGNAAHRLTAADLGMAGGWFSDENAFAYFRERANDYGIGGLEQLGREALVRRSEGGPLLSRDQALGAAMMALNEVSLHANVNTRPVEFIDNPVLRIGGLMLGWPLAKMNHINDALKTPDGKLGMASALRTLGVMAAWSLPAGLAYSLLMDEYDEKLLGKKSNLRGIDPIALTPLVGPLLAIGGERGMGNWLGIMERGARAGIYGLGADAANSLANFVDPTSGQRDFDLNSRVLIFSQYANLRDSIRNLIHSDGEATYQSFGRPLLTTLGGGGVIQATQIINNALGLSNAEAAVTNRINVSNWLRAAGREAGVELKAGAGRSSPTPLSIWVNQMQTMALSNDRLGFLEAYRHAVDVARQQGEADPESKVLAGFKERDPLGAVFRTKPTEVEMAKLLAAMDEDGRRAVQDASRLFTSYTEMIAPNPIVHRMQLQQKAQVRAAQPMTIEQLRRRAASGAMGY